MKNYLHSEEFHDSLVVILISVNGNEQKLSLVVLSDLLGHVNLGGEVIGLARQEQQAVGLDLS